MVVKDAKELFREVHITRWTPDVDNGEELAEGVPGDEKMIIVHHRQEPVNAGPSGVTSGAGFDAVVLLQTTSSVEITSSLTTPDIWSRKSSST